METGFRRLVEEVLKENLLSQEFNELLIQTGVNLESPEWEMTNKMLARAEEMLLTLGGRQRTIH